jgi:hypothetical protein
MIYWFLLRILVNKSSPLAQFSIDYEEIDDDDDDDGGGSEEEQQNNNGHSGNDEPEKLR